MSPVELFKAIADETRLKCLLLIEHEQELCVCEITTALAEIQPKISRHLAQLRHCGILIDRRSGQWVFYQINPQLPAWVTQLIKHTAKHNLQFIQPSLEKLSQMGDRPQRAANCCN